MPSDWASRPALTRWKSGGGDEQVLRALSRDRVADQLVGLVAERQPVLRLRGPGLALGVVERPLVERDDPLPRLLDELLAELDRLGEDDLLLGGQQGDLADLLEVHPDRVVDPDHVGARAPRAPPRWAPRARPRRAWPARRPAALRRRRSSSTATSTPTSSARSRRRAPRAPARARDRPRDRRRRPRRRLDRRRPRRARRRARSHRGEPGLLEVRLRPARARGEDGFDELLVQRICAIGQCPPWVMRGRPGRVGAATGVGRVRRRVCSIWRSSDRRASLI